MKNDDDEKCEHPPTHSGTRQLILHNDLHQETCATPRCLTHDSFWCIFILQG